MLFAFIESVHKKFGDIVARQLLTQEKAYSLLISRVLLLYLVVDIEKFFVFKILKNKMEGEINHGK